MHSIDSNPNKIRNLIYFITFLFTLSFTPMVYVLSTFISQFIQEEKVGLIYSVSSFVAIIVFIGLRRILLKFGNFETFKFSLLFKVVTLIILLIPNLDPKIYLISLILGLVLQSTIFLHLDIFISHYSSFNNTGRVRSFFLTAQNIAFFIGPLLAGFFLTDHDFWKIFLFGAILLFPVFFLTMKYLRDFQDPVYQKTEFLKTGIRVLKNKDIYNAISINGILRVFYSWMIIYTPIYLTSVIGFTISETALIIGLALIPFLIFTNPLGYVADKILGEKEILTSGFVIISIATMAMVTIEVKSFWIWVAILFATRIGASMIEVMGEAYLFKKMDESDLNMVSFFRVLTPLTNIVFPTIASGLLLFIDIKYLFLILGIFMLYGIKYSLAIKDTL